MSGAGGGPPRETASGVATNAVKEYYKAKCKRQGQVIAHIIDELHVVASRRSMSDIETFIYEFLREHLKFETELIQAEIKKEKCRPG